MPQSKKSSILPGFRSPPIIIPVSHYVEANFDGLVGPTHHYGGLSSGNMASTSNEGRISYPKKAALQGLEKMRTLSKMGLIQGIIPPQQRPHIQALKDKGFSGDTAAILERAYKDNPALLSQVFSASSMWVANAATVSPSLDTADAKVHFTPANLQEKFHRSLEPEQTGRTLKKIFADEQCFVIHPHLESCPALGDEGAANHIRFCAPNYSSNKQLEVFCYGRQANPTTKEPVIFPARQTLESCQALAQQHQLNPDNVLFAKQNPDAIDAGVFHNDVISVGNQNVFLFHEKAFYEQDEILKKLREFFNDELFLVEVPDKDLSFQDAVQSYLFNSQLVSTSDSSMSLICPSECERNHNAKAVIDKILASANPINEVQYFDLRQSMDNGGGPACLRLRVLLNEEELNAVNQSCLLNDINYVKIKHWIEKHYRDELSIQDFQDAKIIDEVNVALDELTKILNLGSIYPFQN